MPNHIQCRLKFIGEEEQIKSVRNHIKGEFDDKTPMQIDFGKIVPIPKELDISIHLGIETMVKNALKMDNHSNEIIAMLESRNRQKSPSPLTLTDEDWGLFIQCLNNVRKYGHVYWYTFNVKNWGTKWNAYQQNDTRDTEDTIYFQTAWSAPVDLIGKLHAMFPNVEMCFTYADEDSGSNTGVVYFKNGSIDYSIKPESQSVEGYNLYFELHPDMKDQFHLVDGKYEYIDSE